MPLFEGTFENDQILGTSEDESLIGGAGDDTLDGGAGDDFLKGEAGNDLLEGGDGDDTIDDGIGTDTVDGGAGVDTYTRNLSNDYSDFAFNPVLDLVLGRLYSEDFEDDFDTLISIENVEALGSFHYNLIGDEFDNHLRSGLGDDTLIGGAGYDTLDGGAGDDVLQGGEGNDVIYGAAGVDIVSGGAGSDSLFGGEGEDAIIYTDSVGGVIIDVIAGFAQDGLGGRDQFQGFEAFVGSSFDDEIIGSATDGSIPFQLNAVFGDVRNYETFRGNSGDDTIDGGGGYDELNYANSPVGLLIDLSQSVQIDGFGSVDTIASIEGVEATAFDDVIYGNDADNGLDGRLGNNYIDGRDGYDFVEYNGPERAVVLNLNENKAVYTRVSNGEQYEDRLFNIEGAVGSANDDQLYGDSESNFFYGLQGDDTLAGLEGNDSLEGGYGNDVLDGGDGDDTAVYSGNQNNYSLVLTRTNTTIEDRRSDLNGIDTLSNTEFLDFVIDPTSVPFDLQIFGGSTGLAALDFESFIEFYIAYFNRAPDAVGLNFWGTAFANGVTLEEIATYFIDQDETRATYPDGTSNTDFVTAVYDNVLGRIPDQAGFDFWVDMLNRSEETGVTRDQFILEVLRGVQDGSPDRAYLDTKVDIGAYFAVHRGMSDTDNASAAMMLFDGSQGSVNDAVAAIDGYYQDALDPINGEFLMQVVGVLDNPFA